MNAVQPNGMHKPQFIVPAQIDDDDVEGESLSSDDEAASEESEDLLDFDVESVDSDNA